MVDPLRGAAVADGAAAVSTSPPHVWVDGDACPRDVKELLYRAAQRGRLRLTLVTNQYMTVPELPSITKIHVRPGPDEADKRIAAEVVPGEIVITADIPLADEIVQKGAFGLSPHGDVYDAESIGSVRAGRDLMAGLREAGILEAGGGGRPYGPKDKQVFAAALDRLLGRVGRAAG